MKILSRFKKFTLLFLLITLTACNANPVSAPTPIFIVVTPTPLPPTPVVIVITASPTFQIVTNPTVLPANPTATNAVVPTNAPAATNAAAPTNPPAPTSVPSNTPVRATSIPQPTTALIPTPASNNLTAIWGPHENGFFLYLSDRKEIWAFMGQGNAPAVTPVRTTATPTAIPKGTWQKFPDTFKAGTDQDYDSTIIAPPGLMQPKGGFGKTWRANANVRLALGWATDWERSYIANIVDFYTRSGGNLVQQHTVTTPNGWTYFVDEGTGTWERR